MQTLAIGTRVTWYDQPGMIINMLNKVHKVVLEKDLSTVLAKREDLKLYDSVDSTTKKQSK